MRDQRPQSTKLILRLCSGQVVQRAKRKAQSTLESTVAYAAAMAILGAATGVFAWGIAHIPPRQITYEATRILAGTPRGRQVDERGAHGGQYIMPIWPTYCTGGGACGFTP